VSNVNVERTDVGVLLVCFLCGTKLPKRTDKNKKPYFVCDGCGIQLFIRKKQGMNRLERLFSAFKQNAIPFEKSGQRISEIQAMLDEIDGTKSQIKTLDDEIGLFFPDEHKIRSRNALKTKLDNLLEHFEEFCSKTPI